MTYKDWRVFFQAYPEDWHYYPVLADYIEDAGDQELAKAVRWLVKQKKRPQWYDGRPALARQDGGCG